MFWLRSITYTRDEPFRTQCNDHPWTGHQCAPKFEYWTRKCIYNKFFPWRCMSRTAAPPACRIEGKGTLPYSHVQGAHGARKFRIHTDRETTIPLSHDSKCSVQGRRDSAWRASVKWEAHHSVPRVLAKRRHLWMVGYFPYKESWVYRIKRSHASWLDQAKWYPYKKR